MASVMPLDDATQKAPIDGISTESDQCKMRKAKIRDILGDLKVILYLVNYIDLNVIPS